MDLSASENASTVTSFAVLGICTQLAEAAAALRWKQPTPIQEQAVPHLLQGMHCNPWPTPLLTQVLQHTYASQLWYYCAGRDVIGLAQTGSGKTGAFALPILQVQPQPEACSAAQPSFSTNTAKLACHCRNCWTSPSLCLLLCSPPHASWPSRYQSNSKPWDPVLECGVLYWWAE